MRIGFGYDIHRLSENKPLVLGGVTLRESHGLEGHSDADVLLHAIMDALLGAMAMGDIGRHFPPGDAEYKDISSVRLLREVSALISTHGYRVVNIDSTIVAEAPRLNQHVDSMRQIVARELRVAVGVVSIKATTNERLGPEGRFEGISAHAVALLEEIS